MVNSQFLNVKCGSCKNEQIIFNKASTEIKCLVCGEVIAAPSGGISKIKAEILKDLSKNAKIR